MPTVLGILKEKQMTFLSTMTGCNLNMGVMLIRTSYLITYLLTPYLLTCSMVQVILEQLTVLQLVKKFPAFHGTRRFITALTGVRHL